MQQPVNDVKQGEKKTSCFQMMGVVKYEKIRNERMKMECKNGRANGESEWNPRTRE